MGGKLSFFHPHIHRKNERTSFPSRVSVLYANRIVQGQTENVMNNNQRQTSMPPKTLHILMLVLLSLVLLVTIPASAQTAPYTFTVSPVSAEGKPGDTITYTITISANNGFNSPISFTMDVGSLGYSQNLVLGTYEGPYPKSFTYVLTIPQNVPTGVTADVTVNGKSGAYLQQQNLKLKIKGSGGPVEDITSMVTDLINTVLREIGRVTGGK
jgi:hypothetical protein